MIGRDDGAPRRGNRIGRGRMRGRGAPGRPPANDDCGSERPGFGPQPVPDDHASHRPLAAVLPGLTAGRDWLAQAINDLAAFRQARVDWGQVASRVLLTGPDATGMSEFVAQAAIGLRTPLVRSSCTALLGAGPEPFHVIAAVRAMADKALRAPSLLCIEELDLAGGEGDVGTPRKVLGAALKRAIDDLAAAPGTFLVGMTDRIDQVDQTLLGPARLGRHLEFGRPSLDELREIVSHHAASFLPARQIEAIARSCQGLGRSEVMHWLSEARHRAARDGRQATIDDVLCAMRKGSPGLPRDRLRRIAVRHIGHAAVGLDLGVADDGSVSIVATPDRVGASILSSSSTLETRQGLLDRIATCFGGRAAECVLYGGPSIDRHAQSSDVEQATAIARDFVLGHSLVRGDDLRAAYPACERPLVHRDCRKTRQAISRLLADAEEVAVRIVGRYSQGIARAADALLDRHAMSLADLRSYLGIATPARRPRRG